MSLEGSCLQLPLVLLAERRRSRQAGILLKSEYFSLAEAVYVYGLFYSQRAWILSGDEPRRIAASANRAAT